MKIVTVKPVNLHDQFRKAEPMLKSGEFFNPLGTMLKNIRERTDKGVEGIVAGAEKRALIDLRI